ncbi:MAG: hypothetical protein WA172_21170 [Terriglobales bacterium]
MHRVLWDEWPPIRRFGGKVGQARARIPRAIGVFFLLAMLLAIPVWARSHSQPTWPASPSDPAYLDALATANRFLHAWQAGDLENGMVLLSDGVRHSQNADKLEEFFSASTERAFEIASGHGHRGRYRFPVVLITPQALRLARRSSEIIVVKIGKNDWVVDKLP